MKNKQSLIIIGIVLLLVLGGIGIWYTITSKNQSLKGTHQKTTDTSNVDSSLSPSISNWQLYSHESGFTFQYPENWNLSYTEEAPIAPIINRIDVIENIQGESNAAGSNIAVIMTNESPTEIGKNVIEEFDGISEGTINIGNTSGDMYKATRQQTSHTAELKNSQLEYITTIQGQTFWFRLFSTPDKLAKDREIFTQLISSFTFTK